MSKFKIGDRVVINKGQSDEDTGTIKSHYLGGTSWNVKWDSDGMIFTCTDEFMSLVSQQTYPIALINEYLAYNDMDVIEQSVFDKWVTWKQTRLESLKESVVKMQQEISALEAQLK